MRKVRLGWISIAILGLIVVGVLLWSRTKNSAPPFAIPNPNAFDTLSLAGANLRGDTRDLGTNEIAEFLEENRDALVQVRNALDLKFEAPLLAYDPVAMPMQVLPNIKKLALALDVEGQNKENEGKHLEAATVYMEIVRLGQKVEHGPLIYLLVGLAVEKIGLGSLEKLAPNLPAYDRISLAGKIDELNRERITFGEVKMREHYFMGRNSPTPIHYFVGIRITRKALSSAEEKQEKIGAEFSALVKKLQQP